MRVINAPSPRLALALLVPGVLLDFLVERLIVGFAGQVGGAIVSFVGVAFMIWGWFVLRSHGTTFSRVEDAARLVTTGPFRLSRHPMYLGIVLFLLGLAVGLGSLPLLIPPVGYALFMSLCAIPAEERRLEEIFGAEYAVYRQRVRMWI